MQKKKAIIPKFLLIMYHSRYLVIITVIWLSIPKRDISTARCKCTIYIIATCRMPGHHLLFLSTEAGVWMDSRLEKPIIREKRAETSLAAFIKLGFPIARINNWETQERVFEEERLIFNLSLKRGSLRKYKDYSWAFENDEKNGHFKYEGRFQKRFFKNSNRLPKTQEREI